MMMMKTMMIVLELVLAETFFWGAALYSPREATLALSDRGLMTTVGGGAVPFFFFDGFVVAAAVLSLSLSFSLFRLFTAVVVR